jgi:hypothetical protein
MSLLHFIAYMLLLFVAFTGLRFTAWVFRTFLGLRLHSPHHHYRHHR